MKTKLTLMVLIAILVVVFVGCTKDDGPVVPLNALSALHVASVNHQMGFCTTLYAGQDINAGEVCAEVMNIEGEETLCITYTTTGGWELVDAHMWVGENLTDMPQTRKGNPKIGNFTHISEGIFGTTVTFFEGLDNFGGEDGLCGDELLVAAHAALQLVDDGGNVIQTETGWGNGDPMVDRGNWATFFSVQFDCSFDPPEEPGSFDPETAFARDCENATCFIGIDEDGDGNNDFNRWGWTNGFYGPGTYYLDIYAGAGQCDLDKGTLVGLVTVEYDGVTAIVTYNTCGSYTMTETHLYVGNDILESTNEPGDPDGPGYTISPGQFPNIHEDLVDAQTDVFEVSITGDIYIVAHAVVYGDYFEGDCGERGCVPPSTSCKLFLSETLSGVDDGSIIYTVDVSDTGYADLTTELDLTGAATKINFNKPHLAVDPFSGDLYLINSGNGNHLGKWDGTVFTDLGSVGPLEGELALPELGTVLAAFSDDGNLFVANQQSEKIYQIDPAVPAVIDSWDSGINIAAADMTFIGNDLYLWTNSNGRELFKITSLNDNGTVNQVKLSEESTAGFTGLAYGACTNNKLLGSSQTADTLFEIDTSNGDLIAAYPFRLGGSPFDHWAGDMASGF